MPRPSTSGKNLFGTGAALLRSAASKHWPNESAGMATSSKSIGWLKVAAKKREILVVGLGNMSRAMLSRWIEVPDLKNSEFNVLSPNSRPEGRLEKKVKYFPSVTDLENKQFDVIIFAVKPQQFSKVLPQYVNNIAEDGVVVSIAAGVSIETINETFPQQAIIRLMPNSPATVGEAMTGMSDNQYTSNEHAVFIEGLMKQVGETVWVEEKELDVVTAISGSGPAYVYDFMKNFVDAAKKLNTNLSEETIKKLVFQTMRGSLAVVESMQERPHPPTFPELIGQVASKGGTTEAALKIMKEKEMAENYALALKAAEQRGAELREIAKENAKIAAQPSQQTQPTEKSKLAPDLNQDKGASK